MRFIFILILFLQLTYTTRIQALDSQPIYLGEPNMYGWVPEAPVIKGCIVINGFAMDARWMEACDFWDWAIIRVSGGGKELPDIIARGMKVLGERTGHPELVHVPMFTTGYSRFSPSAHQLIEDFPGRVLCASTGRKLSGKATNPKYAHSSRETPTHWLGCEWENMYNRGDKTTLLPEWRRPAGVTNMVGMTWRVYHAPHNYHDLAIQLIDSCIRQRIPADWDPRQCKPELTIIPEKDGWLGSHAGWWIEVPDIPKTNNENAHIAPFAEFEGDKSRASWLVDEEMAWAWRAYNSRNPKVDIIAPGMAGIVIHEAKRQIPAILHSEAGVRAGRPFTTRIIGRAKNISTVEIYAATQKIGEVGEFTGGESPLGSTLDATAELTATIPERGMYTLMAKYTTTDGDVGWSRGVPLFVWGVDE